MTKFLNISTDDTLGGNSPSDEVVSSQKALKTYIDTNANNVVWVTYNSTPFADIKAAMRAGKIVLLKYTTNWNEYILRATNLILGATEYIYFTTLDTYTHVAYARVSSAEAWIYGGQTNQPSISDLATIRSGAAAGATAVQPGDLATVATSGNYSDLSGTPTIPTTLAALTGDVSITTPTTGEHLVYDGSKWKNTASSASVSWGGITGTLSNQTDLQNALNAKEATITGAATTITTNNLSAARALVSDSTGKVAVSTVTSTELGYMHGVTSAIQTQLNNKQATLTAGGGIDITSNTISVGDIDCGTLS